LEHSFLQSLTYKTGTKTMRWHYSLALISIASLIGCSNNSKPEVSVASKPSNTSNASAGTTADQPAITGPLITTMTPAGEIVTLFFESLQKGDATATRTLLTEAAQAEIDRRGLTIDPLGSSESNFRVGRTQFSDKEADAAFVEAQWVEPGEDGQPTTTEVVFTVHLENNAWRISGMVLDMGEQVEPVIVDFENMADSALTQQGISKATAAAPTQLTLPANTVAPATSAAVQTQGAASASGFALPQQQQQIAQPMNQGTNRLR
jgi:hypothetical protein